MRTEITVEWMCMSCIMFPCPMFELNSMCYEKEQLLRYIWHDLKKNPKDVPKCNGYYMCVLEEESGYRYNYGLNWNTVINSWIYDNQCEVRRNRVIAWMEIPVFEGVNDK